MFKSLKISFIISSILYMALGAFLLIWPTTSLNVICYAFGGITLFYGFFRLASYLGNRENPSVLQADCFFGIIMIGIGIFLLIQPDIIRSILPIVLGLFIIFNSIIKLQYAFELKAAFYEKWWILLFLGIVTAGLGTVIAFNPFASTELMIMAMGIVLVADGLSNLFTLLFSAFILWQLKRVNTDLAVVGTGAENVVDNDAPEVTDAKPIVDAVEPAPIETQPTVSDVLESDHADDTSSTSEPIMAMEPVEAAEPNETTEAAEVTVSSDDPA